MAKIRNGDSYLETHLSANDYYCEKESVQGLWVGRGAGLLGIEGHSISKKDDSFERLRINQYPLSGEKLTKKNKTTRIPTFDEARKSLCQKLRMKGDLKSHVMPSKEEIEAYRESMKPICNRIAFFDFQCGCSKSVSIMAIVGGDDRLKRAHEEAVFAGLKELEFLAARQVDVLGRKHLKFTGNIAAAIFQHDSSRSLDPQLHTHCVVANATFDEDKQEWFALSEFEMVKAIRYAGKVYQNELAKRVQALGYNIAERRNERGIIEGFEIADISQEVMKRFSKRRSVIEKEIAKFKEKVGRFPSPAEIAVLTKESRESKKLKKISTQEVRAHQMAQLTKEEQYILFSLKEQSIKIGGEKINHLSEAFENRGHEAQKKALLGAKQHVFERSSVLPSHKILAEALNSNLGSIDLEHLKETLHALHAPGEKDLELGLIGLVHDPNPLVSLFTSKEHLDHETWAINYINASAGKRSPLLDEEPVISEWLAKEQADAVKFICSSRDAVCAVRGVAGAGKTTMLKELHQKLLRHKLLYLAPTASAVKVLKEEGFLNATTVSEYLLKAETEPWHHAVIIVDEAGLQSTKQGYEVLRLAQEGRQRLVFVGDSKQHVSVEAGDFLRLLETHSSMKSNELKDIKRQVSEEYRKAIALMAEGNAGEALESFQKMGSIHEGGALYLKEAAKDYLAKSEFGGKASEVIAVAPTWSENFVFTDEIRQGLKEKGILKDGVVLEVINSLQWTKWQKEQVSSYRQGLVVRITKNLGSLKKGTYLVKGYVENGAALVISGTDGDHRLSLKKAAFFDVGEKRLVEISQGDRILLRANEKKLGLVNGSILTVEKVESDGSITSREGLVIPSGYRHFTHGYVVTSHKSQGKTAEHVVIAAAKLDEKAAYVATSRGRMSCDIHTPESESLIAGARQSSLRLGVFDAKEKVPSLQVEEVEQVGKVHEVEDMKNLREVNSFKVNSSKEIKMEREIKSTKSKGSIDLRTSLTLRSPHPMKRQSDRVEAFGFKVLEKLPRSFNVALETGRHVVSQVMKIRKSPSLSHTNKIKM